MNTGTGWECTFSYIDGIASVATVLAIISGGIWAFYKFITLRENKPHIILNSKITSFRISKDFNLIHVDLEINNIGKVLAKIEKIETRLLQVIPVAEKEVEEFIEKNTKDSMKPSNEIDLIWPKLEESIKDYSQSKGEKCEIEPGEIDNFEFDFVARKTIKKVCIYSYIKNCKKRPEIGWHSFKFHDIGKQLQTKEKNNGR
jgi:hypothetical protein